MRHSHRQVWFTHQTITKARISRTSGICKMVQKAGNMMMFLLLQNVLGLNLEIVSSLIAFTHNHHNIS